MMPAVFTSLQSVSVALGTSIVLKPDACRATGKISNSASDRQGKNLCFCIHILLGVFGRLSYGGGHIVSRYVLWKFRAGQAFRRMAKCIFLEKEVSLQKRHEGFTPCSRNSWRDCLSLCWQQR